MTWKIYDTCICNNISLGCIVYYPYLTESRNFTFSFFTAQSCLLDLKASIEGRKLRRLTDAVRWHFTVCFQQVLMTAVFPALIFFMIEFVDIGSRKLGPCQKVFVFFTSPITTFAYFTVSNLTVCVHVCVFFFFYWGRGEMIISKWVTDTMFCLFLFSSESVYICNFIHIQYSLGINLLAVHASCLWQ